MTEKTTAAISNATAKAPEDRDYLDLALIELAERHAKDRETIVELEEDVDDAERALEGHDDECMGIDDFPSPEQAVDSWLTRQTGLGLISPEGRTTVERLLADLS